MKLKVNLKVTQGKIYRFGLLGIFLFTSLFVVMGGSIMTPEKATPLIHESREMDLGVPAANPMSLEDQLLPISGEMFSSSSERSNKSINMLGEVSEKAGVQPIDNFLEAKVKVVSSSERTNESIRTWGEVCEQAGVQPIDNFLEAKVKVVNETVKMIVGFYPSYGVDPTAYHTTMLATQATLVRSIEQLNAIVVQVSISSLEGFMEQWGTLEGVRYVEPSQFVSIDATPNDEYWSAQWGPQKIQTDLAWDIQMGNPDPDSVLVAVIDTGIDYTHPDLSSQYVPLGYDFVNNDPDPLDDHYHGTHCAGIVAATINNGLGIAGVANVAIMAEKGLDYTGGGYDYWLADCILHAVGAGANILSNSWGAYTSSTLIEDVIAIAADNDVVIVAAAGNENTDDPSYPASYPQVISVSATNINDDLWYWSSGSGSNYGPTIELAAPGESILSTIPVGLGFDPSYLSFTGTSMACPHVAAVAALIRSEFPTWSAAAVRQHLGDTADDLGDPGWDPYYGYGRLNAYRAVQSLPDHDLAAGLQAPIHQAPSTTTILNAMVTNQGLSAETDVILQLFINGTPVDSVTIPTLPSGASQTLSYPWTPTIEGIYNVTAYAVPQLPDETFTTNNIAVKMSLVRYLFLNNYAMEVEAPYNWIDATSGAVLFLSDDDSAAVSLPFSFPFYDQVFSTIYVGSNGWLSFYNTIPWDFSNPTFPSTTPEHYYAIALFWDDLNPLEDFDPAKVYVSQLTDPNRVVIEYYDIDYYGGGVAGSFEVILYETGEILFQYDYLNTVYTPTVGLNYGLDSAYYNVYDELTSGTNDLAIRFFIPEHDVIASLEAPPVLRPGESTVLNATVTNKGLEDETNVELQLWINSILESYTSYDSLSVGASETLSYSWTPTAVGIYNITAYAVPVPGETQLSNNRATAKVKVSDITGKVLFDEAHLPAYSIGSNPADDVVGGYSEFAGLLMAAGLTVETINPGTVIDASVLSGVDVLICVASMSAYASTELDAIVAWVAAGGSLLLISDWGSFGQYVDPLAARFGFDFVNSMLLDLDDYVKSISWIFYDGANLNSHPITTGISRVEMYGGDGLNFGPIDEIPIIITDTDGSCIWDHNGSIASGISVMSVIDNVGGNGGRMGVIGDTNVWDSAYDADSDGTVDFYDSDNEILAMNTIEWLIPPPPLMVTIISPMNTTYPISVVPVYAINNTPVDTAWWRYWNSSWSVNQTLTWDVGDGWWEAEGLIWYDGNYQVQVFANDSVGNEVYAAQWFTVDTTPPDITAPPNLQYEWGTTSHILSWTVGDRHPATYELYNNSVLEDSGTWTNGTINWNVDGLSVGTYNFTLVAWDVVGNKAAATGWVTVVDTTGPLVTIDRPQNKSYSIQTIPVYARNTTEAVDTAWWRYWNTSWYGNYTMTWDGGDGRWEAVGLFWLEGSYQVQVFFNDSYGNEAFAAVWFTVDITPPTVWIEEPQNITYTTSSIPVYAWNTSEPVDTAKWLYWNTSWSTNFTMTWDGADGRWEAEGLNWFHGRYQVQVFFNDSAGNEAFAAEWFTVLDLTPPAAITDLSLINPQRTRLTLNWTAPGDDGMTGTAIGYEVKYSTAGPIVEAEGAMLWNRTYGGSLGDAAYAFIETADGDFVLAGYTEDGAGGRDFWLVKADANGNYLWNQTYGGAGDDWAFAVIQTSDSGFALAGLTTTYGVGGDAWLVKTDPDGVALWNQSYGGSGVESAIAVIQTSEDGGFALVGYTTTYGAGDIDFWLVKTNATGYPLWNRTYGGSEWDVASAGIPTADGGFALAGYTNSTGAGGFDAWLVKTNATGWVEWNQTYGTYGSLDPEYAYAVFQTADNGFVLAGFNNSGGGDALLVRTDVNGVLQWNQTYGGSSLEEAFAVIETADGGFALAGATQSYGAGGFDAWLVKTNANGVPQWNQTYGGLIDDDGSSIIETANGGFALAGRTTSFGAAGAWDFWLVQTVSSDTIPWDAATTYSQAWTPQSAGTTETHEVSGLSCNTKYWFAIKAYDDGSNYGGSSNSPSKRTSSCGGGGGGPPPNQAPTVTLTFPNGGEILTGEVTVTWEASDPDGNPLLYTLSYWNGSAGAPWVLLAEQLGESSYPWDTTTVPDGFTYHVQVEADDSNGGTDTDESDAPFSIDNVNQPPEVQVLSPNGGEIWIGPQTIQWTGYDPDGHDLTYTVQYSLDDGVTWEILTTGLGTPYYEWDTTQVDDSSTCLIRVVASDGVLTGADSSDAAFAIDNIEEITTTTPVPEFEVGGVLGVLALVGVVVGVLLPLSRIRRRPRK